MPLLRTTLLLVVLLLARGVAAQVEPITSDSFEEQVQKAFDARDYRKAADLLERQLKSSPNDPVVLYNAACAWSRLGDLDRASDRLFKAVQAGFMDFAHMERDPDLDAMREHPVYRQILDIRDEAFTRFAERQLEGARRQFGENGYRYETDREHRLNFATALDEVAHAEMRDMLRVQADHLAAVLFEAPPDYYTLIAVPTPEDSARLIRDAKIGGIYEHPRRRLVARDIGIMLRHEFTHLMHYGHMERLRQSHPIWIQEGIACLYESYEIINGKTLRVLPNQRHNIVKFLLQRDQLPAWSDLFAMSGDAFMDQAEHTYPVARSIFHFLLARRKLTEWYRAYTESFDDDPTGARAFETVFNEPLADVERRWKQWVRVQPMVDDVVRRGDASLGVEFDQEGSNDGVLIVRVLPGSGAEEAGLRSGDVIVSVNGQPTRSFLELLPVIGGRKVGDVVTVRVRRGAEYHAAQVTLRPLR
ncbi:MAG: PDZ domain-containing protein [Phycisphaeraceae bacterium]|nr:PDZ domain-containing protein [Phycisphaerales bacterium]QOJ17494.1 MAG: PDZ domain-containing protein [Phycisphaeraceae bacterium]